MLKFERHLEFAHQGDYFTESYSVLFIYIFFLVDGTAYLLKQNISDIFL